MSTSVMSDAMVMPVIELESQSAVTRKNNNREAEEEEKMEIEFANCDCCGLTEECTRAYMERIKQRHQGKWICGLCSEAVKDEMARSQKLISCEEAMTRHTSFCKASRSPPGGPPPNPAIHLISAMRKMLFKRANSAPRSMPSSPMNKTESAGAGLFRSESCMPTLTLTVESSSSEEQQQHGDSHIS
nr:uncharacterized protein LOC122589278 isoform X2 [Erigeron canadensis]